MGLRINSNIDAFNTHRNLSQTANRLSKSMEKLSSGFRINRAADDAAGLGISERMRSQISGLEQAQRNAEDGISYANTADGALSEIQSMLQRIRDLAVQSSNGTNDANARTAINTEVNALASEITRTITSTQWNGVAIINGAAATTLQVGANAGDTMTIASQNATTVMTTLSIGTKMTGSTAPAATTITDIDTAIASISTMRGAFGSVSNRLEHTVSSLGIAQENIMAAESRIRDVDMASEMVNLSKLQILQESGVAMLAQANMHQSAVLKLLS